MRRTGSCSNSSAPRGPGDRRRGSDSAVRPPRGARGRLSCNKGVGVLQAVESIELRRSRAAPPGCGAATRHREEDCGSIVVRDHAAPMRRRNPLLTASASLTGRPRQGASAQAKCRAARGLGRGARGTRGRIAHAQPPLAHMPGSACEQQAATTAVVVVGHLVDARSAAEGKPVVAGEAARAARTRGRGVGDARGARVAATAAVARAGCRVDTRPAAEGVSAVAREGARPSNAVGHGVRHGRRACGCAGAAVASVAREVDAATIAGRRSSRRTARQARVLAGIRPGDARRATHRRASRARIAAASAIVRGRVLDACAPT
jgi:hypothetical protein